MTKLYFHRRLCRKTATQIITMPTTSDTTRAEPKNFLIHLNVKASFAALPPCESPQAAKRPVVSHLFTPAAAGCHWDSEGEIPWFSLPFLTAPAQATLIRDCGASWGDRRQAWMAPAQASLNRGRRSGSADNLTEWMPAQLASFLFVCCWVKWRFEMNGL